MAPRIVILLIAASLMCCIASDFDLIKLRTLSDLRGPSDGSLPPPPSADGTWRDIDYRSGCAIGRVEWPAVQHLDRTLAMARSCGVANATLAALDFWFKRDYRDEGCTDTESDRCCDMPDDTLWNSNWWWNRIGDPRAVRDPVRAKLPDMRAMTDSWARRDEFAALPTPPLGNRVYASSDYVIHRRPNYFVSVKAASERVAVSECINGENTLGHRLGDGVMFVNRPGAYDDVFPLWNWNALPGITVPASARGDNGGCATVSGKGDDDFVGGASDGHFGVFAMRSADGIRKAWFMFDDEIVVAIVPTSDGETMRSVLDSRVLRGDVTSSAYGDRAPMGIGRTRSSPWWIRHDSVTYIVPDNARGANTPVDVVTTVPRDGRWSRISTSEKTVTTKATFTAWFEHRGPSHYIIVPHTAQDPIATIDDVVVRQNSDAVQCIVNKRLGTVGIVFWEAWETASFPGWRVTANRPCVVLAVIEDADRHLRITIADPTHKLDRVSVSVTRESDGVSGTLAIDTSAHNGASHTVLWDGSASDSEMSSSGRPRPFLFH